MVVLNEHDGSAVSDTYDRSHLVASQPIIEYLLA